MLVKLRKYPEEITRRRELAARYGQGLGGIAELTLPPAPGEGTDHFDIFQNYEIEADQRDALRVHLEKQGIRTIIQWGGSAVHQFPSLNFNVSLHRTEKLFTRCFLLPMNTSLTNDEVDYVCAQIRLFYHR